MTPKTYFLVLAYVVTATAALTFLASLPNSDFVLRLARLTLEFAVAIAWPTATVAGLYVLREPLINLFHQIKTREKPNTPAPTPSSDESSKT